MNFGATWLSSPLYIGRGIQIRTLSEACTRVESARNREMRPHASLLRCYDYTRSRLCTPCCCVYYYTQAVILFSFHCTRVIVFI